LTQAKSSDFSPRCSILYLASLWNMPRTCLTVPENVNSDDAKLVKEMALASKRSLWFDIWFHTAICPEHAWWYRTCACRWNM
jgi:hypothetical protein